MKVATFFHGDAEDPKISKVMAYTSWYNPSWEGCVVYDVEAKNGTEAKRVAREMRLASLKSYLFIRDGGFYPVDGIKSDAEVIDHVRLNPGTRRVINVHGKIIWDLKRDGEPPEWTSAGNTQ